MNRYGSALTIVAWYFIIVGFYILLGHFPVLLARYHAHSGSELGVHGTCHKSMQLVCVQMRSQRIIVPNQNSRYMLWNKLGIRSCLHVESHPHPTLFSKELNGTIKQDSKRCLLFSIDDLGIVMVMSSGIGMITCPVWRCYSSAWIWFGIQAIGCWFYVTWQYRTMSRKLICGDLFCTPIYEFAHREYTNGSSVLHAILKNQRRGQWDYMKWELLFICYVMSGLLPVVLTWLHCPF